MHARLPLPIALLLVALAACGPSAEEQEAAAVLHAADVLRDAPAEPATHREGLLADLERKPASGPLACEARDACVRAYRPLLEGNALEARVRAALQSPAGAGPGTLADLAAAEAKIRDSAAAMPECERGLAQLRRAARR